MTTPEQGSRFGRLTFVRVAAPGSAGKPRVGLWRCECGAETRAAITRVVNGYTASCGCLNRERTSAANTKHGMHRSPEYSSWQAMCGRCRSKTHKDYPRYGARGVVVCDEWANSFEAFYAAVGPRPEGTTLDRIDGTRGYVPGNVRWATPRVQSHNRKDLVVVNTPLGVLSLVDYAAAIGISKGAAHLRLARGKLEGVTRV